MTFHICPPSVKRFAARLVNSHSLDNWSGEGGLEVGHVLVFIFKVGAGLLASGHPCAYGHHRRNLRDLSDLADRGDLGNRGNLGHFGRGLYWLRLQIGTGVCEVQENKNNEFNL